MMVESKIKELFLNPNSVYIFDVDGVLAKIEYGEYNHYYYDDELWSKMILENDYYENVEPLKTMQDFLKNKDLSRVYVATKVMNDEELKQKKTFLAKNYGILGDHVYSVLNDKEKLNVIKNIQKDYQNLDDKYFVMIDDTVDVLNNIMDNSSFSTVHISSFIK